jgi:hypothetical protein
MIDATSNPDAGATDGHNVNDPDGPLPDITSTELPFETTHLRAELERLNENWPPISRWPISCVTKQKAPPLLAYARLGFGGRKRQASLV